MASRRAAFDHLRNIQTVCRRQIAQHLAEYQKTGYRKIEWFGNTLKVSKEYYESGQRFAENLERYEQAELPALVIHGTNDTMVPAEDVDAFVAATGAHRPNISGAGHGYGFYSGVCAASPPLVRRMIP